MEEDKEEREIFTEDYRRVALGLLGPLWTVKPPLQKAAVFFTSADLSECAQAIGLFMSQRENASV